MSATEYNCPHCGKPVPATALQGICPECMLKVGALADSVPDAGQGPEGTAISSPPESRPLIAPEIGRGFGRYRILRRLGHGGMGVVYEAEEVDSARRVALKVINQKLDSPHDRARFLREGRLAAAINHPNCVYVFGTEEIEGTPVIAMEFVTGGTLQHRLNREGPLKVGQAVDAILQVIEGLEAAQAAGILHRDVKPSNCFEDAQGTVKIGDFGLSLSTLPRPDTSLTASGMMVGTPAFCPPEQLRGEELNARSDMYAVGVTLYQLLTGKLPFEGQTMPQLVANVLEKHPPSPCQFRKDIPAGLARVILRCLERQPAERYRTYADLRRALDPYRSSAPTPATLGLRFLAGLTDVLAISALGQLATLLLFGNPFTLLDRIAQNPGRWFLLMLPCFALVILYFAVTEWRWGATLGKALCRLRVLQTDRNYPTLAQALGRAAIYNLVPALPYWLMAVRDPRAFTTPTAGFYVWSLAYYLLLGLLFASARRRNGFAALHDLATRTRVVSRAALEARPPLAVTDPQPAGVESKPRIGPYHLLQPLGQSGDADWMEAYDLRLLRRVLVRTVPADTPPLPVAHRHVGRAGRLRWLAGRRDPEENWDAFEGAGGKPLLRLVGSPQPWQQVRFWLHDLAGELSTADTDGTRPAVLALDRVWITREGRAKLLDFPAPGTAGEDLSQNLAKFNGVAEKAIAPAQVFLDQIAAASLGGWPARGQLASSVPAIIPLHARRFLEALPAMAGAGAIAAALKPLLRRAAAVTRLRRLMIVIGCVVLPLFMSVGAVFGFSLLRNWQKENPELMEMSRVLNTWRAKKLPFVPKDKLPSDRLTGIYIAAHYGPVITNDPAWSSALTRVFIPPEACEFAERCLTEFESPTAEDLAAAEAALGPLAKPVITGVAGDESDSISVNFADQPGFPALMCWIMLLMYVGLPAVIAALLFRGGLVLLIAGVTLVCRDGRPASRLRLFLRSLGVWAPSFAALALAAVAIEMKSALLALLSALLVILLTAWSLLSPERGLQDRLAGTWPVPR